MESITDVLTPNRRNRTRLQTFNSDPTRTKQSFKDECDINLMIARWRRSGEISHLGGARGHYGDFSDATDYQDAVNAVQDAQASFMELSSEIRSRMNNDPAQLMLFLSDPNNIDEAEELGLVEKRPQPPTPTPGPKPPETTKADSSESA